MITSKEYRQGFRHHQGYLAYAALAEKEGYPEIAQLFRMTAYGNPKPNNDTEKTRSLQYQKALKKLAEMEKGIYYVCSRCGYTNRLHNPEKCPHCMTETITLVKVG
ncbi:MAG: rubrerythrin family protein [Deltaproteobacteria bacterium]|nr:MAG: rubrerythrin family protein [Deltaproteobacteria bacterium]